MAQSEQPPVLGHGLNLGNFLEAPHEGDWSGGRLLQGSDFALIAQAGFHSVRIPVCWSAHVGPGPDFLIDPLFVHRVDWVVAQAKRSGLQAILDYHNDDALCQDPDKNSPRFLAIWKQLAEHYQHEPATVLFELFNEPHGKMDAGHWNQLLAKTLQVVRLTNPQRMIIVGPVVWNNLHELPSLILPATDTNLLVTFHYYEPFHFTHQGAGWVDGSSAWMGHPWLGTEPEIQAIKKDFDRASAWSQSEHRPIFLGEFGAYEKGAMDSRVRWTAAVARCAEAHGFPWAYWEFCSGFGVYDPTAKHWRKSLLDALIPR